MMYKQIKSIKYLVFFVLVVAMLLKTITLINISHNYINRINIFWGEFNGLNYYVKVKG